MLSVTCTQCNAHYTMSEELYRRKGGGQAVIVTCKRCKAEIRFDAAHLAQQKPTHRSLPKPKVAVSKALESSDESGPFVALSSGFFGPEMAQANAEPSGKQFPKLPEIESSLDSVVDSAAVQPLHVSSPAASRPAVAPKPATPAKPSPELLDDDEAMSVRSTDMLDESVTVPLVAPKPHGTGTIRRFPAPPPPRRKGEGEHEPLPPPHRMVDEELEPAPPSSSGTPTLTTLMGESTASNAPKQGPKKPDDFLLTLSAAPATVLGPPTIDLSTIAAPSVEQPESVPPPSEAESEPPPSSLGSVPPAAAKKRNGSRDPQKGKKRREGSRSGAPSARASARPSADPKRNQPSNASLPVAKPAEQREQPQRSGGLWIGVGVLLALVIGAVVFKSTKKEQVVAQNEAPPAQPIAPAAPVQPAVTATAEPVATASAAPEPADAPAEKDKPAEAKPSEEKPSAEKPSTEKPSTEKPSAGGTKEPAAEPTVKAPAAAEAKPEEKPAETSAPTAEPAVAQHGPFQADAAKVALAEAAAQAAACRKGDDPAGSAAVIITFAPSGRVTSATLNGPPFAGTATGGCIASTMRRAKVPPFDGDKITVSKTIYVQ
jgi:hypothetical protein